jgi:hypothetical protein
MKLLTIIFLFCAGNVLAQDGGLAHFSVWSPRQEANFKTGYKQHLQWHKANNDSWNWYGWYVISGTRAGQFIDATFNHFWADFDNPVNPAGDGADNALHTEPFADYLRGYKMLLLPFSDKADAQALSAKFLRMFTVDVSDVREGAKLIEKAIGVAKQKDAAARFIVFEIADGGNLKQMVVLAPVKNFAAMEGIKEFQNSLQSSGAISGIISETLSFQPEMSMNVR